MSIVHVLYASAVFRGLYDDGASNMLRLLDWFSDGIYNTAYDPAHPRYMMLAITQLPAAAAYFLFSIKNKFALMFIYSFFQFAIPLISLYWSCRLAERTNKPDIFLWNLFTYGGIILLYEIYSVTESIQGISFHFILWNYLAAKMEYAKRDILGIIFLVIMMFGTFEYISYLGIFFFICSLCYAAKDESIRGRLIKIITGAGCLAASIYTILFMLNVRGEDKEIIRFLKNSAETIPCLLNLNSIITIAAAVIIIYISVFKKERLKTAGVLISSFIMLCAEMFLFLNPDKSINPWAESTFRIIPCFWLIIIFVFLFILDTVKLKSNDEKKYNLFCIVLLCSIFQTFWQINNTYYFNKNIQDAAKTINYADNSLYIFNKQDKIFRGNYNEDKTYIMFLVMTASYIMFENKYKFNTIPVWYEPEHKLFDVNKLQTGSDKILIPYGNYINIKNKYWDLTECAAALEKFNKEHNIENL